MKQEEEIRQYLKERNIPITSLEANSIIEITKREVISKACEWLEEKNQMCMYELDMILGRNFINDFKKAMEE